jgi:3-oxoadipate enol-lactonase
VSPMPTVEADGVETYYEQFGDGPPIVFLHGGGSDHRIWAERAQALADEHTVVVPDLRGHGYTGGTDQPEYTIDTYVEDVHALLDELDLDGPVLCGLSLGGMVAQRYAATYPETIAGLVTLGATTPERLSRKMWFNQNVVPRMFDALGSIVGPERSERAMNWVFERVYGEETVGDIEAAERIKAEHDLGVPEMSAVEGEKQLDAVDGFRSLSIAYGEVTAPALLMYGEREFDVMADHAERMADMIPDAEAREVPEAGHNAHVDSPEFVVDALREFVRERVVLHVDG